MVVLHILGGDFELSRLFCNALAHRGVSALFVKMPYYGPRRAPGQSRRMVSSDPSETVEGLTQAVLDIRRAVAWLASRPEVDADRIGIFGISMGGITAALAVPAEPRIRHACFALAGGDLARLGRESPELARIRKKWLHDEESREQFLKQIRQVDPVEHAHRVRDCRILMLNATEDEVIPRDCTDALWDALGKPEIVWYRGGHYSVAWHLPKVLARVTRFFAESTETPVTPIHQK